MTTLPISFKHDGFHFQQLWRDEKHAIYQQGLTNPAFEAIAIRWRKETTMPNGAILPEGEVYPSPSKWGEYGFTLPTFEKAMEKVQWMKDRTKQREQKP